MAGSTSTTATKAGPGTEASSARTSSGPSSKWTPELVLVLVKAAPDVIRRRMRESPHKRQVLQDSDVEKVLSLFEEGYAGSLITNKFDSLVKSLCKPNENKRTHTWVQYQPLFRILAQHTVALRCAESLELPQTGFYEGIKFELDTTSATVGESPGRVHREDGPLPHRYRPAPARPPGWLLTPVVRPTAPCLRRVQHQALELEGRGVSTIITTLRR